MLIEVWSDFSCPFCYIGKTKLEKAISKLNLENKVKVLFKSYQLNPDAPMEASNLIDAFSKLKGLPKMQVEDMFDNVTNLAKTVGLTYHMEKSLYTSTFRAHKLSKLSVDYNTQKSLVNDLMDAYFTKGLNINDLSVLVNIGEKNGIPKDVILDVLNNDKLDNLVESDINEAYDIGITGVPFFVFDRKYAISGAQPDNVFESALLKLINDSNNEINEDESVTCSGDECLI